MAIQDLFIFPSREECKRNGVENGEYGITIRIYDPKKDIWNVFYGCPGETSLLKAYKIEDRIEQYCVNILIGSFIYFVVVDFFATYKYYI